jgi:hypothetical protein
MVPDQEREWIAAEMRNTPHPGRWWILGIAVGTIAVWAAVQWTGC